MSDIRIRIRALSKSDRVDISDELSDIKAGSIRLLPYPGAQILAPLFFDPIWLYSSGRSLYKSDRVNGARSCENVGASASDCETSVLPTQHTKISYPVPSMFVPRGGCALTYCTKGSSFANANVKAEHRAPDVDAVVVISGL